MRTAVMEVPLRVQEIKHGISFFEPEGEMDFATAPQLEEALQGEIRKGNYKLIVSLEDLRFLDSSCLKVLLDTHRQVRPRGGGLSVVCSNPYFRKMLALTTLDSVFDVYESMNRALGALASRNEEPAPRFF